MFHLSNYNYLYNKLALFSSFSTAFWSCNSISIAAAILYSCYICQQNYYCCWMTLTMRPPIITRLPSLNHTLRCSNSSTLCTFCPVLLAGVDLFCRVCTGVLTYTQLRVKVWTSSAECALVCLLAHTIIKSQICQRLLNGTVDSKK